MRIIVDNDWLKGAMENSFLKVFKILFLFTNDTDESEALTENIFINLIGEREFESERHFEMWLLRQAVKAGEKAQLINKGSITDKVLLLEKGKKLVFHLHNYAGYSVREISGVLRKSEALIQKGIEEAENDLGIENIEAIKLKDKDFFDRMFLSDKLKERMKEAMETNNLVEVKTASDLQKERARRICWIASLALIVVCLIIGSGIL